MCDSKEKGNRDKIQTLNKLTREYLKASDTCNYINSMIKRLEDRDFNVAIEVGAFKLNIAKSERGKVGEVLTASYERSKEKMEEIIAKINAEFENYTKNLTE